MPRLGMCSNNLNYLQNKTSRLKRRVDNLIPEFLAVSRVLHSQNHLVNILHPPLPRQQFAKIK